MANASVLVVDDDDDVRSSLLGVLRPLGLHVQEATSGEEALGKLEGSRFAVVFLDLHMTGKSGMDALRAIREKWPETAVIMMTAHGSIQSAVEALKLGASDFVEKPIHAREVRQMVDLLLEGEKQSQPPTAEYSELIETASRYIARREFGKAREAARKAVSTATARPEGYNLLGALLEIGGDWVESEKYYRAALEFDPAFRPARANLDRVTSMNKIGEIDLGQNKGETASPDPDNTSRRDSH